MAIFKIGGIEDIKCPRLVFEDLLTPRKTFGIVRIREFRLKISIFFFSKSQIFFQNLIFTFVNVVFSLKQRDR